MSRKKSPDHDLSQTPSSGRLKTELTLDDVWLVERDVRASRKFEKDFTFET